MSAKRRLFVVALVLGMVAAACSSSDDGKEPAGPAAEEQPVRGGTFVVGLASLPNIGLLSAVNTQGGMQQVAGLLYNGLVELDEAGKPVPELATSWDIRENGKVYEFTLREGVKWHDFATSGKYVTAADVKFSFEVLLRNHGRASTSITPALEQPCSTGAAPLSCPSITASEASPGSPAKVTFRFANPYAPLLQQLLHTDGPIIPRHVWDGKPPPTAATPFPDGQDPVGTGPFKFSSQNANEIVFARNPDYFKAGLPYLDRVVWRVTAAPRQDLETGAIDWIWSTTGTDLPALRENPKIAINTGTVSAGGSTNCTVKLLLNLWKEGEQPGAIRDGSAAPHRMLGDVNVRRRGGHGAQPVDLRQGRPAGRRQPGRQRPHQQRDHVGHRAGAPAELRRP
jgi:peptide/nickel transport system substrate-binding protein